MFRIAILLLGLAIFGGSLRQCLAHERTYECTKYDKQKKDSRCAGKTPGTYADRGLTSDLDAAGGMFVGLVLVVFAAMTKPKKK